MMSAQHTQEQERNMQDKRAAVEHSAQGTHIYSVPRTPGMIYVRAYPIASANSRGSKSLLKRYATAAKGRPDCGSVALRYR